MDGVGLGEASMAVSAVFRTSVRYCRQTFKVKLIILQLSTAAAP